ncbi:MAG TPA: hypothetical protein VFU46_02630, partial [Gemmatimonadales bacterium]|nr:hypothetical protein [Gemmatimonadales bacterium]
MRIRTARRAGTSLAAALLVALAACGDRGRGDQADTTGAAQVGGTVVGADTLKPPGPPTPPVSAQADTAAKLDTAVKRDTAGGAGGRPRPVPDTLGRRLRTDTAGPRPRLPVPGATRDTAAPAAAQPPPDPYHRPPRDTVSAVVYEGWKYYNLNCARCHGEDVLGTTIAPHL